MDFTGFALQLFMLNQDIEIRSRNLSTEERNQVPGPAKSAPTYRLPCPDPCPCFPPSFFSRVTALLSGVFALVGLGTFPIFLLHLLF